MNSVLDSPVARFFVGVLLTDPDGPLERLDLRRCLSNLVRSRVTVWLALVETSRQIPTRLLLCS